MAAGASDSMAARLKSNDPELVHLYLSSDSLSGLANGDLSIFIAALSTSEYLRHVYFRNFKLGGSTNHMERFMDAMNSVSKLESLFFHCTEVPLAWLTRILMMNSDTVTTVDTRGNGANLKVLGFRYCKLRYHNEAEYQAFEHALRQHAKLQDICIECCEWQPDDPDSNNGINNTYPNKTSSFLEAIAHIPTLAHVECVLSSAPNGVRNSMQRLPASALLRIGQIPQLASLRLRNVWFPEPDVVLLCHSLIQRVCNNGNTPHQLRKLILSCDLGSTSALAIAQLLQRPQSGLQQLSLRVDALHSPDCPRFIAQALRHSTSVVHFHLSGTAASQLSARAKHAFGDMMQTNVSLEFVRLDISDYHLQSQVAFYLQLNHKGRRELFRGIQGQRREGEEAHLWIQALCQNATNLAALHHFVALNPGFFALSALQVEELKRQKQHALLYEDGIDYDSDAW